MISLKRMFQSIQTYNQKLHTYPNVYENLNFTNYTKWCNEIKKEIAYRWRLQSYHCRPFSKQSSSMETKRCTSNVLDTLHPWHHHYQCVIDHTPSAHELWTWISTFLGPSTDERESEKREESRSESENLSFRRSNEFKNEKVSSKVPVSHRNGGKTTFSIPHQENRQTSIPNQRTPKSDFIK